jgi:hypothetical protein
VRQNYFNARIRFGKLSASFKVITTEAVKVAILCTGEFLCRLGTLLPDSMASYLARQESAGCLVEN